MTVAEKEQSKYADGYVTTLDGADFKRRQDKISMMLRTAVANETDAQDVLIVEGEIIDFKIRGRWVKQSQLEVWDIEDFNIFLNKICRQETVSRKGYSNPFTPEDANYASKNERTIDNLFFSALMNDNEKSFDFSAHLNKTLRVHVYSAFTNNVSQEKAVIAIRLVPNEIPDLDDLNLPSAVADVQKQKSGIFIISGHTGAGKTTTAAAIVKAINMDMDTRRVTLTVEDPIEFVHESANGRVIQRQLKVNVLSYSDAAKDAVREGVDVVYFGELREEAEMYQALRLAEMGKLVIATMHANSVADTGDRFVGEFSPDIQESIRSRLFENLVGILHQNLKVYRDKQFPVASTLMITRDEVRTQVRDVFTRAGVNNLLDNSSETWAVSTKDAFRELMARGVEGLDEEAEELFS